MAENYTFSVILDPQEDGSFAVRVPALPELMRQGATEQEALKNAEEAIRAILEYRRDNGIPIPADAEPQVRRVNIAIGPAMSDQPTSSDTTFAPASARVSFAELLNAFEFVSAQAGIGDNEAFICRQTGKIYWRFEDMPEDEREELPDDLDDEEKYLPVPDKRELDLGKPLVLSFARGFLPDEFDYVRDMFSRRGAYGQFKALLARKNAVDLWHDFEDKAAERGLREWCDANSIALAD